jgi:long-chain fatty acid transport protein
MKAIFFAIAVCFSLFANAQGFQVSLQGQRQQAMAGAGTAYMKDGASLFYNPGGVSFLENNSASLGTTAVISRVQYVDKASSTVSKSSSPASFPFTGYFVGGKKGSKLKYGLAAYTPFGSTADWEEGWTGRFVLTHIQLFAVYIQPTISYKINDQLGVGAGFVYSTGKVNVQKDIPVLDANEKYGHAELDGKASGIGFNAGIYYKPTQKLSFGFTYRSKVNMDMKDGDATFTVASSLSSSFPSGKFSTSISLPDIMTLGIAYQVNKKLVFVFDANLIGWKSFDTVVFDYENNTPELADTKSTYNYKNAASFRLGAQYQVNSKLEARAGIKHLGTSVRDGYLSPDVPDASHVNYSAGLGYKLSSHFSIDASLTLQTMKREGEQKESGLNGTYKTNLYMPGFSVNYNF